MTENTLDSMVDEVVEEETNELQNQEIRPVCTDPKWVEYVIEQLADHELVSGAPTTDGLRRVAEKVFGEILESNSEIINITDNKVTAKHTLVIAKYSGQAIRVSACVDVLADKLPHPFNVHLASTACTRAEGKALRRALKIRVHTAEELANVDDDDGLHTDEAINDQQMAAIKTMCKRHDVDIVKFIKANAGKAKSLRDVKNLEGRLMINKLSTYQREGTPADVTGYDENWEEAFGG